MNYYCQYLSSLLATGCDAAVVMIELACTERNSVRAVRGNQTVTAGGSPGIAKAQRHDLCRRSLSDIRPVVRKNISLIPMPVSGRYSLKYVDVNTGVSDSVEATVVRDSVSYPVISTVLKMSERDVAFC